MRRHIATSAIMRERSFALTLPINAPIQSRIPRRRILSFGSRLSSVRSSKNNDSLRLRAYEIFERSTRLLGFERKLANTVVFPHGTYLAVQRWNVLVEPAPT